MPKRRDVLKRIAKQAKAAGVAWDFDHEGGNHTVYRLDGLMIPIPRHSEIDNLMADVIYRECAAKLGKGWWR